ncbi:MAG: N-acetylneuraminate synthase family protein [Nonlabens sp.]|uniref:N-acetylneuraminate synthase family protein n=1 Tax=Nonlabens sp. TaxID=1888209 RepID=UPI003EFA5BF0
MKIIAESAFNHQGSLTYLKNLANEARKSGADFFTCQVMNVEAFCTQDYSKYTLYKETEFSKKEWIELFDYCNDISLDVIPCVLDEESFSLCYSYGYRLIKIHATDITNKPLLEEIAQKSDCRVILETQCATLLEVKLGINILGEDKVEALFSGYSNYPSEVEELNLNVLDTFKNDFGFHVGFADHTIDTQNVPLMLLAKGCRYIEKHITLSRNHRNFDWQVSLYPHEFASMVHTIRQYELALGNGVKHPTENEKAFRNIMYKKVVPNSNTLKRSDKGQHFIENKINTFDQNNIVVAVIARLKSQRLKNKVLLPFGGDKMIVSLYQRLSLANKIKKVFLTTSNLNEDKPLVNLFQEKNLKVFEGHPISVIDRMLDLAMEEQASAIFRVTGDNPFTDPQLLDEMVELLHLHDLDYVKVNGVPFGVGAELFSTKYLWNLYLQLDDTMTSEYLSWYVLNDEDIRMGAIDVEMNNESELVNLSVDYEEDYLRCLNLLNNIGKKNLNEVTLKDIDDNLENCDKVDVEKEIKLPKGQKIKMKEYIKSFKEKNCIARKIYIIK